MAVTLDSLKKTIGKKKVKSMAFAWLADYENMAGDVENALARVNAGLGMYPGDIPGMLVRSKILFQKGDFEECIKECERVLQKEPFCLSAQKRMGEAYEQLENIDERNRCFRRVHDMDPLDTFWKEEYETVSDMAMGAAAGAVAGAMDEAADSEFAMPDLGDMNAPEAEESAEPAVADAEPEVAEAAPAAEDDSPFSKSLDMDIESPAQETAPEQAAAPSAPASPFSPFSPFSQSDDDPFAALAALGGEDSSIDEAAMDSLQKSLDSAVDETALQSGESEELPTGEEISGNDVGSAFSNLFGDDDDLDSFEDSSSSSAATASASPFAQMDLPTSLDDEPEQKESVFDKGFETETPAESLPGEDKPQSVDSAFNDIFGEDELPEELPSTKPAAPAATSDLDSWSPSPASGGMFEKSASSDMGLGLEDDTLEEPAAEAPTLEEPVADKPQSLDSAFADIFGEDELPEELPAKEPELELPAEEASLELPEEPVAEKPAVEDDLTLEEPAPDKPQSVDSAFADIFGEDELPEELPAKESEDIDIANWSPSPTPAVDETAETVEPAPEASLELPSEESALELPAEEPALELPAEEPALELPAEEPSLEMPSEEASDAPALVTPADELALDEPVAEATVEETPVEEAPVEETPVAEEIAPAAEAPAEPAAESAVDGGFDVGNAFDALFAEEDELPEEKPAVSNDLATDKVDTATEEIAPVADELAPAADTESFGSVNAELDKEMGAAFSQLFADADDDLPVENETKEAAAEVAEPSQEDTGAAIEEAPLADATLESDLDKSFSNLFGEDDSLDEAAAPAAPAEETPAVAETAEMPAEEPQTLSEKDSLESEFSGAFKQLFNTDDDSLDEKPEHPNNKGVDFLMSGDSDDEVTARLVSDPNASLDKLPSDLDESLNTPTLADIYFEQGLYGKALDIYQDLVRKDPENEALAKRLAEVEAAFRSKSGGNLNG